MITQGLVTAYLTLIVLLPLAAVVWQSTKGERSFWDAVSDPQAVAALKLTLVVSVLVALVNAVVGTLIAWVLVRDEFPGKSVVNAVIDLPFALPTIVAGLTLLALYGPQGPFGIDIAFSRAAILVALLFVTLPFVVRTVQPVLLELDREMEEAAASLGANALQVFRRVVFPNLFPAVLSGVALAFARAIGEFGSVVLISGNLPFKTEVASVYIFGRIESGDPSGAAAVSVVLLVALLRSPPPDRRPAPPRDEARPRWVSTSSASRRSATSRCSSSCRSRWSSGGRSRTASAAAWASVTTPEAIHAFWITILITLIVVPANTIFGIACAIVIVRHRFPARGSSTRSSTCRSRSRRSSSVLRSCSSSGPAGGSTTCRSTSSSRFRAMVLATIFVSLPFVVREVVPVLREIGIEQEQAASTLGASSWQTFRRVTLPAIRWAVAYGIVLTTARALGEFGAVSVVSGRIVGKTETMTLHVEERFQSFDYVGAYAASVVLAILAIATLVAMNLFKPKEGA